MKIDFKFKGVLRVQQKIGRIPRYMRIAAHDSVGETLKRAKDKAQEYCPKKYGNLRSSNYIIWSGGSYTGVSKEDNPDFVNNPDDKRASISRLSAGHQAAISREMGRVKRAGSVVGIIGYSAYYADFVHEVEFDHYTTPGTGSKYLQRAINETFPELPTVLLKRARSALIGAMR